MPLSSGALRRSIPTSAARRSWRVHAFVVALALASAGVMTVTPAEAVSPPAPAVFASGLRVNYTLEAFDGFGTVVTGEVENTAARTMESVRVVFDQRDAAGEVLGSTTAYALAERLDPGERTAFKGYLLPLPGFAKWTIRNAVGDLAIKPANHNFTLTVTDTFTDEYGLRHLQGTVRNDNTGPANAVIVNAQFLANGTTVDAEWAVPDTDLTMAAGEVAPFEIVRMDGGPHNAVVLTADANNDPSPLATVWSVSGGGTATRQSSLPMTGRLIKRHTDAPVAGAQVSLLRDDLHSDWAAVSSGVTDDNGFVNFRIGDLYNAEFKLDLPSSSTYQGGTSSAVRLVVSASVSVDRTQVALYPGNALFIKATVEYPPAGQVVTLQRWTGRTWQPLSSGKLTGDSYRFKVKGQHQPKGKSKYRVVAPASARNGAGTSPVVTVKVRG